MSQVPPQPTTPAPAAEPAAAVSPPSADAVPAVPGVGNRRPAQPPGEIGGPAGPEPTRYGDWESKGRCSDF
ncbi:DUF1674 domain-containing protein [Rhodospirillum centenum]|nr:succinate dehydrogenase assembly factor 4 [Rhodospirillum centenum]